MINWDFLNSSHKGTQEFHVSDHWGKENEMKGLWDFYVQRIPHEKKLVASEFSNNLHRDTFSLLFPTYSIFFMTVAMLFFLQVRFFKVMVLIVYAFCSMRAHPLSFPSSHAATSLTASCNYSCKE
ncbi:unnamed protein product [Dovyalis caffra]|uniref:Uncharacterized protein n=1 Tax=Dovyalis caffra TaxID=77055 RepID=A0AAV1S5K6_9ROSI|nr:unnamed protein product [Dovyalis caffra]